MSADVSPELDGGLPVGFYEQLRTPLILAHILCHHVFYHPQTVFTKEVAALTGLDADFVATMHEVHDNATLAEVMQEQSEHFLWYLHLSHELLTSPLSQQLVERLQPQLPNPAPTPARGPAEMAQLMEYFVDRLRILAENFSGYLTQTDEEAQSLELAALQLEGIVARQLTTLPPLPRLTLAPDEGSDKEPGQELDEGWVEVLIEERVADKPVFGARFHFQNAQLHVMRLALTLPSVLPEILGNTFAREVAAVEAFRTPLLESLRQRLLAARPDESMPFTRPELALLFRAVQVCGMVLLLPDFEDLMLSAAPVANAPDDAAVSTQVRQVMAVIVTGFVELIQREFGTEPAFVQAQQETRRLADLL
ncbi:MAG: hypothetical protein H7Z21_17580 [Hymenobacter sp.]|nr:hypothetical protein [Hymenobacter sp.]